MRVPAAFSLFRCGKKASDWHLGGNGSGVCGFLFIPLLIELFILSYSNGYYRISKTDIQQKI